MKVEPKNIRSLIATLKSKGYQIFERPNELNIVGVRNNSTDANKFDDFIYVLWKDENGKWEGKYYNATTDPGTYYLKNPLTKLGAAILKEGQWLDTYSIGKHRGQYDALVQSKPLTVIRDYDRNAILDFNNGREQKGLFGINIHKGGSATTSSAGCQTLPPDQWPAFKKYGYWLLEKYAKKSFLYLLVENDGSIA
jgi:hypothetical protein